MTMQDVVAVPVWAVRNRWAIGPHFVDRVAVQLGGGPEGELVLERRAMKARLGQLDLALAPSDFLLLEHFVMHAGECIPVPEISQIIATSADAVSAVRARLVVHRLRQLLLPYRVIHTRRGAGYVFTVASTPA